MNTYTYPQLNSFSDDELIELVKEKNEAAFEVLTSRYIGLISSIASKYENIQTNSRYDQDDFIQEGLLGLFSACGSYDSNKGSSFKNYVVICVENNYRTIMRKIYGKNQVPVNSITNLEEGPQDYMDLNQQDLQEIMESKEYIRSLHERMKEELSSLEYTVLNLRMSGLSRKRISEKLGKSEKSVDNAIQRAYTKLRS